MQKREIALLLLVATSLIGGCSTLVKKTEKSRKTVDPNFEFGRMIKGPSGHHNMASAFLAWFQNDDIEPLVKIAKKNEFVVSQKGNVLTGEKKSGGIFFMAILKDVSSPKELANVLTTANTEKKLPILIIQYSNDVTDRRGENVFDIYGSKSQLAIYHTNRVYTKKR